MVQAGVQRVHNTLGMKTAQRLFFPWKLGERRTGKDKESCLVFSTNKKAHPKEMRDGQRELLSILIVGCKVVRDTESTAIQTDPYASESVGVGLTSICLDSTEEWGGSQEPCTLSYHWYLHSSTYLMLCVG